MTAQEIFRLPVIDFIEIKICDLYWQYEQHCYYNKADKEAIKQLLCDFNKALSEQLLQMRLAVISAYNAVKQTTADHDVTAIGKCFMAYQFSPLHPKQSKYDKEIWNILSGAYDDFVPFYQDGVISSGWQYSGGEPESENNMLYLSEKTDNWNEGLSPELTSDMHLIYPFHNLYEHTCFSIFDLLWVRDFNVEISVEYDYAHIRTNSLFLT